MDLSSLFKKILEVFQYELITKRVSLDDLKDDESIVLFKYMLVAIVVKKVFVKGRSINVAIIKEVNFSKPTLQVDL